MSKPNLFNYATSELSQDAFICWLLEWAKKENEQYDSDLYQCGQLLIREFFNKANIVLEEGILEIEIFKQSTNIDVLAVINKEYAIIIEDKTHTKNHSNQLQKYIDQVISRGFPLEKIIPVYFKTYDQSDYNDIYSKGYKTFLREELLKILNSFSEVTNDIFIDYRNKIESIENDVNSYLTLPIEKWSWNSWVGFYKKLQCYFNGNWDYVPNPNGGFLGFWWNFIDTVDYTIYLQIESNYDSKSNLMLTKLCFKIKVDDKLKRYDLRRELNERVCSAGSKFGLSIKKPQRFGHGLYMTIAVLEEEFRSTDADKIINTSKTFNTLDKCSKLLEVFVT